MIFNSTVRTRQTSPQLEALYSCLYWTVALSNKKIDLVRKKCHLGLSISPDRLLDISTSMENRAIDVFEREGVVCPLNLRHGLFTTAVTDNLDINPSSATAMTSFHGTTISLNHHVKDNCVG